LARKNEVTFLSYYGGPRDSEYEEQIEQELPGCITLHTGVRDSSDVHRGLAYAKNVLQAAPFAVSKFTDRQVRQAVRTAAESGRFDVAVCDFLSASLNFPEHIAMPSVLFQHNVESSLWHRMGNTESNWLRGAVYRIEAWKMKRYETKTLGRFRHIIAVSDTDRQQMLGMNSSCQITVVPTGVDTEKYRPAPPSVATPPIVVFTGSMDWEPNVDAMEYFCAEIWPLVLIAAPGARFQIVGRDPHPRVRKLASASVEVTGTVPSVGEYLRDATVVVVPLRIGGGTRLKIFEAMAMSKALVSTAIGAEGLDVRPGRDILFADEAKDFAANIVRLIDDEKLRHQIECAAAEQARRYDWACIAERFAEVLASAAHSALPAAVSV
jgi:glycosyltransferase involved in cell wall biosynthesis